MPNCVNINSNVRHLKSHFIVIARIIIFFTTLVSLLPYHTYVRSAGALTQSGGGGRGGERMSFVSFVCHSNSETWKYCGISLNSFLAFITAPNNNSHTPGPSELLPSCPGLILGGGRVAATICKERTQNNRVVSLFLRMKRSLPPGKQTKKP